RIEKALAKLGISYQDVSDPEDDGVQAAYFAEMIGDRGALATLVVTASRGWKDVWVQGGVVSTGIADLPDAQLNEAIGRVNADLQHAPAGLFSRFKLPSFHSRGFTAGVSWSIPQRQVVGTVVIPSGEFSSAVLDSSIRLAAQLAADALATVATARKKESLN
ncbi:MAG TPA: hypothetical protein VHS28_08420, partial [Chloroflexota bacterium]|nr:hypothetical protein [Chloroflexota bacterium]